MEITIEELKKIVASLDKDREETDTTIYPNTQTSLK